MPFDCKSPDDVLKIVKDEKIQMVDLRFTIFLASCNTSRCHLALSSPKASATGSA